MTQFEVRTVKIQSTAETIGASAGKLKVLSDTVRNVSRNLPDIGSSDELIAERLLNTADKILAVRRTAEKMETGLQQIAAMYKKADADSADARIIAGKQLAEIVAALHKDLAGPGAGKKGPRSNEDLLNDSARTKDSFIRDFEKDHPEIAREFNRFLEGGRNNHLTAEDIRNIKYLAYNAPEPYRSIYLKNLKNFKINDADMDDGAFYKQWVHTLNYSYPDCFGDDPRGPYTTVFHECGHAIDDLSNEAKWLGADTEKFSAYSSEMGREVTLREAIEYDVYYNKDNPHIMTSIASDIVSSGGSGSKGNIDNVIRALQNGTEPSSLSKNDRLLFNAVVNQHQRTTGFDGTFEAVSDVYGGMSRNKLVTGYYHETNYWNDKNNAGSELWAEYFSYNMAGDTESISNLRDYFPSASEVLDAYADTLAK